MTALAHALPLTEAEAQADAADRADLPSLAVAVPPRTLPPGASQGAATERARLHRLTDDVAAMDAATVAMLAQGTSSPWEAAQAAVRAFLTASEPCL